MFHEVQFPTAIAYGSSGGPEFNTDIVELASGYEQRNPNWTASRARYSIAHGIKTETELAELLAFFRARQGKAYGFRLKDHSDFNAFGQLIGTGDNSNKDFQLVKTYTSGSTTFTRTIKKPVSGTVVVYLDGTPQGSGFTVDTTTGVVSFTTAPGAGVLVTADFEFDVPVRFDTDIFSINLDNRKTFSIPNIQLVEIRV